MKSDGKVFSCLKFCSNEKSKSCVKVTSLDQVFRNVSTDYLETVCLSFGIHGVHFEYQLDGSEIGVVCQDRGIL